MANTNIPLPEIDRSRPGGGVGAFGHGFHAQGPPIPTELLSLVAPQQGLSKSISPMKNALNAAKADYDKLSDPATTSAPLPVQAARLNGVLKTLANAEGAVTQCIRARKDLIKELEKILATNRDALAADEQQMMELSGRRTEIEQKRQAVETAILGGQEQAPTAGRTSVSPVPEPAPPQVEALTPPHVQDNDDDFYGDNNGNNHNGQPAQTVPFHSAPNSAGNTAQPVAFQSAVENLEVLSALASQSQYQSVPSNKKRKFDTDDFPDLGGDDGIDADVKEMLRKDSQGQSAGF
jgi:regulator of Ty1 transposition protein 103